MRALPFLIAAVVAGAAASVLALYYQPQPQHDIVGRVDNSSPPVVFANATNMTDNEQDSVYGQVAAWNSSVYLVWQDSVSGRNYDIFIKKSSDNGTSFGEPVNLSNNTGFSEHPQLSAYGSNVYAVWADNTYGNREVLFAKSTNGGTRFENARNLSNNTLDSYNQEMAAFGDSVYVVWLEQDGQKSSIKFSASSNAGATFNRTIDISSQAGAKSLPKVAAYGGDVYVTWNDDGLYYAKSSDGGSTFGIVKRLADSSGESQVAAYNGTVYVISGGLDSEEVEGLLFLKSGDWGETFADPAVIDAGGRFANPLNVEIASDSHEVAYVVGQVFSGDNEEIFLMPVFGGNATGVVNLSRNEKISECPSIAIAGVNIYVVWEDLTPGNHEVLYAKGVRT